ncbi:hypothetical protein HCDG_05507 [Histoplasma capsulatum H143]|uniref:Uncharacterized protein n=1 Tax=Ajellomyces capsulatus (strain H143) TaxID=544712 RepID=C6HH26_AJECH|nr:hypothetical protein HCDG_05507 [Histoplasma capsulatum H143]
MGIIMHPAPNICTHLSAICLIPVCSWSLAQTISAGSDVTVLADMLARAECAASRPA